MKCIYVNDKKIPEFLPEPFNKFNDHSSDCIVFPENDLSMEEQRKFNPITNKIYVITNSPFIVSCFRKEYVLIQKGISAYEPVNFETYGSSFEVLFKMLNKSGSLLPQIVVEEIREHIKLGNKKTLSYLETIGDSSEKAYLKHKLKV
jgi:hypothetical protein